MRAQSSLFRHSSSIVIGLFFALTAIFIFETIESHASFRIDLDGLGSNRVRLSIVDDDVHLRLRRDGKVFVTADGSIERADPGARLELEDRERGQRLTVEGTDSEPTIVFLRGRETKPFDASAQAWLADSMNIAYRRGGLDASRRADKLLDREGVGALVDEVRQIDSDDVAQRYLRAALETHLDPADLARVLDVASEQITSDHTQMMLLREMTARQLEDSRVLAAYSRAAATIRSDHSLARALGPMLDESTDPAVISALLGAATGIQSDHEAAQLLIAWAQDGELPVPLPETAFSLLDVIASDHSLGRAASELAERVPTSEIPRLVDRVDSIQSDHELSQFLRLVIDHHLDRHPSAEQEAVRASVEQAAQRIGSQHERERVVAALAGR